MPTLSEELVKHGLAPERKPIQTNQDFNGYLDDEVVSDFAKTVRTSTNIIYSRPYAKEEFKRGRDPKPKVWEGKMLPIKEDSPLTIITRIMQQTKRNTVAGVLEVARTIKDGITSNDIGTYLSKLVLAGVLNKEIGDNNTRIYSLTEENMTYQLMILKFRDFMSKRTRELKAKKKVAKKSRGLDGDKLTEAFHNKPKRVKSIYSDVVEGTDSHLYKEVREEVGSVVYQNDPYKSIETKIVEDIIKKIVVEVIGKVEFVIRFEK